MAFIKENGQRLEEGRPLLRTPGRDAERRTINKLDKFFVKVKRYGAKEAMRKMRAVQKGLTHSRPLERVEMDEWKIDGVDAPSHNGIVMCQTGFVRSQTIERKHP